MQRIAQYEASIRLLADIVINYPKDPFAFFALEKLGETTQDFAFFLDTELSVWGRSYQVGIDYLKSIDEILERVNDLEGVTNQLVSAQRALDGTLENFTGYQETNGDVPIPDFTGLLQTNTNPSATIKYSVINGFNRDLTIFVNNNRTEIVQACADCKAFTADEYVGCGDEFEGTRFLFSDLKSGVYVVVISIAPRSIFAPPPLRDFKNILRGSDSRTCIIRRGG
jgi:hypothetical protein